MTNVCPCCKQYIPDIDRSFGVGYDALGKATFWSDNKPYFPNTIAGALDLLVYKGTLSKGQAEALLGQLTMIDVEVTTGTVGGP